MKQAPSETQNPYRQLATYLPPILIFLIVLIGCFCFQYNQQFSMLTRAFLHGQLNFLAPIGGAGQDPVYYHGKIFWSEGPFPSVLLMPFFALFAVFHLFFYQGYLQTLLIVGVLLLVIKLARLLDYSAEDSIILGFGFCLGSVFIGVAVISASWYFAQVVTTILLFWGLYEFFRAKRQRWWLLGIICGLVLMTRATAVPIALFFMLELWLNRRPTSERLKALAQLVSPMVVAGLLLALYNYLRFQSPFHGGYADQLLYPMSAESQSYGLFAPIHIPTNVYSAFLRAPAAVAYDSSSWTLKFPFVENNVYGMSMFVTSPYLLYLLTQKWSTFDKQARHLLVAAAASALLVFSYFGVGLVQFGYRYSLDFLPAVFLVFMMVYRKRHTRLSRGMKFLLIACGVTNFYLLVPFIFS